MIFTYTEIPPMARNVLGTPLEICSNNPTTGYYRNGCCDTGAGDDGVHVVCTLMTEAFLAFSRQQGNDLSTPHPEWAFPGLKPGDRWCLCAARWREALVAGVAPPVVLRATHIAALEYVDLSDLLKHGIDAPADSAI